MHYCDERDAAVIRELKLQGERIKELEGQRNAILIGCGMGLLAVLLAVLFA